MAPPMLDTPRTEVADETRLSAMPDLDFTTENSIPSPSKDGHDLLKQIRSMRAPDLKTPRTTRPVFGDRRNLPSKTEFTPLLKSATRNNFAKTNGAGRPDQQLRTPTALRASYRGGDSPGLPFNSSVIMEERTESSIGVDESHITPNIPAVSSSVLSTPMVLQHHSGDGPLSGGGNLATLKEQEARLEQIDKENFGLKLKIHFLEEALRKNGKEFNEAALKENTELKVDKITLQRDLKNYRNSLARAEKDLEEYKRQLLDYAEKIKRRHVSESLQEEMDRLREALAAKEAQIAELEAKLRSNDEQSDQLQALQDEISDLQAELRAKDQELDEKEDLIEELRNQPSSSAAEEESLKKIKELETLLEEKEEDLEGMRNSFDDAEAESKAKLKEKDRQLKAKDEELETLAEQLKQLRKATEDQSFAKKDPSKGLEEKESRIQTLQSQVDEAKQFKDTAAADLQRELHKATKYKALVEELQARLDKIAESESKTDDLHEQLRDAENKFNGEIRKKIRIIEERDFEIHTLTQKLNASKELGKTSQEHLDEVQDLEAELRQKDRVIEEKDDEIAQVREQMQDLEQELDDELMKAQDKIQEMEIEQKRHLQDLQALRDSSREPTEAHYGALEKAQERVIELEAQQQFSRQHERQLEEELNRVKERLRKLEVEADAEKSRHANEQGLWQEARAAMERQKARSDGQIQELEQTIVDLQKAGGSLSARETQLKSSLERERERFSSEEELLKKELSAAKAEARERMRSLEEARAELAAAQRELHETQDDANLLQDKIEGLEDEIEVLQTSFEEAEQIRNDLKAAKAKIDVLQEQLRSVSSGTPRQSLHKSISELKLQLSKAESEVQSLKDSLEMSESDYESLKETLEDLKTARDTAQQQCRDLRAQLQTASREADRNQEAKMKQYERDIERLEEKLVDADSKQAELKHAKESSVQQASQLHRKIQGLETQLASARSSRTVQDTTAHERQDLHEMLKDAKLEAEDLALQISERDSRIASASEKEAELRTQLKRIREERASQASRADTAAKELDRLQQSYDDAVEELSALQSLQRKQVRFPKASALPRVEAGAPTAQEQLAKKDKRHAAELRGLVKQIEYLAARCRREESFRRDLSYVKAYFTQQVEMYGRCTSADLRLVKAMGIATEQVKRDQQLKEREKRARRAGLSLSAVPIANIDLPPRPTLRVLGLMVLAGVRMRRSAESWTNVRKGHDGLLRKLQSLRKDRGQGQLANKSGSGESKAGFKGDTLKVSVPESPALLREKDRSRRVSSKISSNAAAMQSKARA